jgi:UDP-N-acetylmuramoylalanine--D-glutamate ligase
VIGITGSAGKTTTTTLVGRMAEAAMANRPGRAWVGGNIGAPLIAVVDEIQAEDLAVMELSSFQLELMTRSPQIAAVLNLTPNHLDRHGDMQAYRAAKARILAYQDPSGIAILGRDDPGAWSLAPSAPGRVLSFGLSALAPGAEGTFLQEDGLYLRQAGEMTHLMDRSQVELRGEHNLQNVLAACTIAAAAGLSKAAAQAGVSGFRGVAHRLEFVRSWGGAAWYNDSIATAPERAMAAMRSFSEPLVLLAGGRDKDLPWEDFAALACRRVNHLVVFGEAADKIQQALACVPGCETTITRCSGLHAAVQAAAGLVEPGDVVLLSPGGTSFDEFRDFEERGECFVRWVKELK